MNRCSLLALVVGCASACTSEPPRACVKMKELCGTERDTCVDLRADVLTHLGQGAVDSLDGCVLQAGTCSQAAGCVTGQAAKATAAAMADFADAFVKEVSPDDARGCDTSSGSRSEAAGCRVGLLSRSAAEHARQFAAGLERHPR